MYMYYIIITEIKIIFYEKHDMIIEIKIKNYSLF